jgi:hypothetical protein
VMQAVGEAKAKPKGHCGCPLRGHRALSPLRSDRAPAGLGGFAVTIPSAGQALPARRQRSLRTARHSSGGPRRGRRGPHRLPTRVDHRTQSHLRQYRWHAGAGAGARRLPPQASLGENRPADGFLMTQMCRQADFHQAQHSAAKRPSCPRSTPDIGATGEGGSGRDERRARPRRPAIDEELPFGQ